MLKTNGNAIEKGRTKPLGEGINFPDIIHVCL